MKASKRNSLLILNMIVSLVCGLFIYLTKEGDTYLSVFLSPLHTEIRTIGYPRIIKYYACDALWAYALFFCIRLTLGDHSKGKYNIWVITISAVSVVVLETLQLNKNFQGTFDEMDIVVELVAVVIACIITICLDRRVKYEKDKTE